MCYHNLLWGKMSVCYVHHREQYQVPMVVIKHWHIWISHIRPRWFSAGNALKNHVWSGSSVLVGQSKIMRKCGCWENLMLVNTVAHSLDLWLNYFDIQVNVLNNQRTSYLISDNSMKDKLSILSEKLSTLYEKISLCIAFNVSILMQYLRFGYCSNSNKFIVLNVLDLVMKGNHEGDWWIKYSYSPIFS